MLSTAVFAGFGYHLYQLAGRVDWPLFFASLSAPGQWRYLLLAFVGMPLNWLVEAIKFHGLLRTFVDWPFVRTLRVTLAGLSVSAATPNRVGEVGGRLLLAERGEFGGVLTASLLGSLAQWVAFLLLAWPALIWTAGTLLGEWLPHGVGVEWLLPLGPLLLCIGWIGGRPLLLRVLGWLDGRFGLDTGPAAEGLRQVRVGAMAVAGGWACLRLLLYCTQLWLLLRFFGLPLDYLRGVAGAAAIYLIQAGIPLPPGVNLVTRAELGIFIWGADAGAAVGILAAFTGLFALNVLVPAVPGYWFVLRGRRTGKDR